MKQQPPPRRPRAYLSEIGLTLLHKRNPWVAAFWSFAFPGCGNLIQNRKIIGLILICWELMVNTNAKINLSIMYTMLGQFEKARQVVDTRWLLLYMSLYVYGIWDAYRGTVDLNKQYILADLEDAPMPIYAMKSLDVHFFDKRSPWTALAFSCLMPGLGHLYLHKIITGMYMVTWTIVVVYFSNCFQAVHYTFLGDFTQAKAILDMQWFMYVPSIYGFVMYDSYMSVVERNKLFEKEQSRFLRSTFPMETFPMPDFSRESRPGGERSR